MTGGGDVHFLRTDVRAVIMRGRIDAFNNGGFRNPHYGLSPGRDEKPGLWLVGDEGVYILSNGKLADGQCPPADCRARGANFHLGDGHTPRRDFPPRACARRFRG